MLSLRIVEFGSPDRLKLEESPMPTLREGESLVEVRAAGINPSDLGNVQGRFPQTHPPRTPGRDFAGVVVAGGTPEIGIGSEVWGSGAEFGFTRDGSHAEYILVPNDALALKPDALPFLAAGTVGVPFVTAWLTVQAAGLAAGETLLINGVRGAVGSAAAQIVRLHGVRVVGLDRCGEDRSDPDFLVLNSESPDIEDALREVTGDGAHACIDTVGGALFDLGLRHLRTGGRMVVITAQGDGHINLDLRDFYHRQLHLVGVDSLKTSGARSARILSELRPGFEDGRLTVPEATGVPLSEAIAAYRRLAAGRSAGASVPKLALMRQSPS